MYIPIYIYRKTLYTVSLVVALNPKPRKPKTLKPYIQALTDSLGTLNPKPLNPTFKH